MTILEMLEQSGILTLFGIGVVFAFLIIMVLIISKAGEIFRAVDADKAAAGRAATDKAIHGNMAVTTNSAPIIAAITAAVGAYRSKHA